MACEEKRQSVTPRPRARLLHLLARRPKAQIKILPLLKFDDCVARPSRRAALRRRRLTAAGASLSSRLAAVACHTYCSTFSHAVTRTHNAYEQTVRLEFPCDSCVTNGEVADCATHFNVCTHALG